MQQYLTLEAEQLNAWEDLRERLLRCKGCMTDSER